MRAIVKAIQRRGIVLKIFLGILVVGLLLDAPQLQAAEEIYYYHTDHLGTPQLMTDENQQVVWRASKDPFGGDTPLTEAVQNNLRFPGQYYDQETGFHYNWNRYYDPNKGRYITSDPIGLSGGLNTYVYASLNPLVRVDISGTVDWFGTVEGIALGTGGAHQFTLESECKNGKKGFATIWLAGPGLGFGLSKSPKGVGIPSTKEFSFSSSDIKLRTPSQVPDPKELEDLSLDGGFIASGSINFPFNTALILGHMGVGCAAIQLGAGFGSGCGFFQGINTGASVIIGPSVLFSREIKDCCE